MDDFSGRPSFVAMVKPANLRQLDHGAEFRGLNRRRFRRIFAQRQMRPRALVVVDLRIQDPLQRRVLEHDDVLQTFSPD